MEKAGRKCVDTLDLGTYKMEEGSSREHRALAFTPLCLIFFNNPLLSLWLMILSKNDMANHKIKT